MDRPEVHFPTSTIGDIVGHLFASGCALLRDFAPPEQLVSLRRGVDALYDDETTHVFERDFLARGLPAFSEYLLEQKHRMLLDSVFSGYAYQVFEAGTHARRIAAPKKHVRWHDPWGGERWQNPLGFHVDALFHGLSFTVNFWVPLTDCGIHAPSLAVIPASFDEAVRFTGYCGAPEPTRSEGKWNFACFGPLITASASGEVEAIRRVREHFGDRLWAPIYEVGDAMMLTNWTIHGTHATPDMAESRYDVELRFATRAALPAVIEAQAKRRAATGAHER